MGVTNVRECKAARRFVAASAEVGTCPLHSHERYKALYDKLVETARAQAVVVTPEEESDMEASDVEDEVPNVNSDSLPLGTTFRTIHIIQPPNPQHSQPVTSESVASTSSRTFLPRKLSTISSQDRESVQAEEDNEALEAKAEKTTEAEVHAKLLTTTDFDWHPDEDDEEVKDHDPESEALLEKSSQQEQSQCCSVKAKSRYKNTDV